MSTASPSEYRASTSSSIALGSEMSGGIQDVRAEDITAIDTESAVRIKTAVGRGAFVKNIFIKGMQLHTMKWVFWMTGNYKSHPDDKYDLNAMPIIANISYRDVVAENVSMAARLEGIANDTFSGICMSNVTVRTAVKAKKVQWFCENVEGVSSTVSPTPCEELGGGGLGGGECPFREDRLPIDDVVFKECSYTSSA
ncbi:uncharacterized protein A4U43_C08F2240 [Asparagus officinalis]|nr:uncharacterized protein A4U43_C08F2240 [Asparagus officinalis]